MNSNFSQQTKMESSLPTIYATASPSVSDDKFNLFHSIDRKLYTKLITNLGRDPTESMHVMAFWLWLEQEVIDDLTMVNKMLFLPSALINELADESVKCLKCVESDTFPFTETTQELVLLPNFVERNISLAYFYKNRIGVLRGVTKMIGEVCARAFRDILAHTIHGTGLFPAVSSDKRSQGVAEMLPWMDKVGGTPSFGEVGNSSNTGMPPMVHAHQIWLPYYPMPTMASVIPVGGSINAPQLLPNQTVQGYAGTQDQIMENELSDIFNSCLNFMEKENNDDVVSPDERTIFLTFSKGYPISETEVWEFFTRRFGDFIEAIHMQEVLPEEQILYARVVARSASFLDAVVEGGRAKYNINGKHVWARKYVKKQKSPPPKDAALSIQ